jgi:hypothetical protein
VGPSLTLTRGTCTFASVPRISAFYGIIIAMYFCRPPAAWDHLGGLSASCMGPPQRQ